VNLLGVEVSTIDMAAALDAIDSYIARRQPAYVCVSGVHGLMASYRDAQVRAIHNAAALVTPDGMPLVWLCHAMGFPNVERVYGPDLMLAACERSVQRGYRHYFYGGGPGVGEHLARRLCARFPGLRVAGTFSPPFRALTPDEDADIVSAINRSRADIVWVGISTPRQERWMAEHVGRVDAPVLIGVGAAFDFHAGVKRQAPRWMMRAGMEWLFRLLQEPRRLGPRYLANNPMFVALIALQLLGIRRPALAHIEADMPAD
jgi:N-acetylglucosaminyldiphosphoundecaprenol N-acetyl-beta-D-mannosaminyltransferase